MTTAPSYLEGWHFRNADNTGPNDGSVNAPQERREFVFSPELGLDFAGPASSWPSTEAEMARIRAAGHGILTIEAYELGNIVAGTRAHFTCMRFRVEITCAVCIDGAAAD